MTDAELGNLKQQLQQLAEELHTQAQASVDATKTVTLDQSAVGRVSRIDALQQQQMALQAERRRQQQLLQVDGAFTRMENGHYGECFLCGEEIGLKRLKLNPLLTRCRQCAQE